MLQTIKINSAICRKSFLRISSILAVEIGGLRSSNNKCRKTAAYGHFGRNEPEFSWEALDKVPALQAEFPAKQFNATLSNEGPSL